MKKAKAEQDTLRSEYQRSDFPAGLVRGKYAARAKASSNIAVLEPELVSAFPNSAAVNDALRAILRVAQHVTIHP
jgi:septum formation inhibitor-activating ATPase MinD